MEEKTSTSGDATVSSGAGEKGQTSEVSQTDSSGSDKSSSHVEKILQEKRNYAKKTAELEAELKRLREEKLVEKESYKDLAEMRGREAEEWKGKFENLNTTFELQQKKSEVKKELLKLGLNPEHEQTAFRLMGDDRLKDVHRDPETGAILNAEHAAKVFHEEFKTLGGLFGRKTPGVSYDAPSGQQNVGKSLGELSKEEIIQRLRSGNYN